MNHKLRYMAGYLIFAGLWLAAVFLLLPDPPGLFYISAAGLLFGGGIVCILWNRNPDKGTSQADSINGYRADKADFPSAQMYPYSVLAMARILDEEGGLVSAPEVTASLIQSTVGAAMDLPDTEVNVFIDQHDLFCCINYLTPVGHTERHGRIMNGLSRAHDALLKDRLAVYFLTSDIDIREKELREGFSQVYDLLWYTQLFSYQPKDPVVCMAAIQEYVQSSGDLSLSFQSRNMLQLKKQFIASFLDKNYSTAQRLINEIITRSMMESNTRPLQTYRIAFDNIKGLIMDATEAVRLQLDVDFFKSIFPEHGVNEVTTIAELQERCNYIFAELIRYEKEKQSQEMPGNFLKIRSYVTAHIYDPSLNISTIALALEMNSSHVSRVFKEQEGMNLLDYIHLCRIKKAKELLSCGMAIAEVAENVGFGSVRTFSRIFQKLEGISPSTYQRSHTVETDA